MSPVTTRTRFGRYISRYICGRDIIFNMLNLSGVVTG